MAQPLIHPPFQRRPQRHSHQLAPGDNQQQRTCLDRQEQQRFRLVDVDDEGVLLDIDTRSAYERVMERGL